MNKRGFILEIGALILITLTTIGAVITIANSKQLYVGNNFGNSSNYYVDYYKCKEVAKNIPESNLRIFNSQQEAMDEGFRAVEGCT